MKKRDRPKSGGGRAPRPAAPKRTSSQTFAADQAEAPSTPFAYAFLKGQNRNLWQSHAQYKREARSERKARASRLYWAWLCQRLRFWPLRKA